MKRTAALLAFALFFSACSRKMTPEERQTQFDSIAAKMASFQKKLTSYPPVFPGGFPERRQTEEELKQTISSLKALAKADPKDPEAQERLGECYRMGHLLDFPKAWDQSREHLQKAVELDPQRIQPHLTLGLLYVNTSMDWVGDAEKEFLTALELSKDKPLPTAHNGLFFVYLHQNRLKEALAQADRYMTLVPASEEFKKARAVVQGRLKAQSSPNPR
jgi:tetratricopeptide (TPR) repeat protein